MKKSICFLLSLVFILVSGLLCAYAADEFTVSQVEEMLENIDTLQQMQDKRSKYTASGHYDINTTNASTITKHNTARGNYESYLADMLAKRAEAQNAYDALNDGEKAQIDSSLVAKLNQELPTSYLIKEYAVTPRDDEYSFEAVDAEFGYAYEVSNYMVSGSIPQSFILVDTSDGATSWTPSGEYIYGQSNYIVTYCCDKETGLEYGTDYKQLNLEDSGYFDEAEAQKIRAIIVNSYPFVTMDEMKEKLKNSGMDSDFVDSLNRADMIAAVQMAVWSYANINDAAADGLEYFASIDIPRNTGIYFTPLHDYTNEMWEWYPGKRTRSFDTRAQHRVNTLAEFLCNSEPVAPTADQIVISELEVVKTELISEENDLYHITMYITLNGGGNEKDDLTIHTTSYSENEDGSIVITEKSECKAERTDDVYTITTHAKDGDMIDITVDGVQYLSKGAYFYDPEGGREMSQSLVGMSEGKTAVSASKNTLFIAELANIPVQDLEIPEEETELELTPGEAVQITVSVKPENATNKEIIFSSSDPSVASVDENGNVVAVGEGTATITVTSADKPSVKKEITITVVIPEEPDYTIESPDGLNVYVGETVNIGIKIDPDDGKLEPTFKSSNESIVKVDAEGNITGISAGPAIITVSFGNGEIRTVPVMVLTPVPILTKHYICFGKTDGIGWYEVSVNGGDFFAQGPNSTLEVEEGSVLVVRVQDMWIDDEFDFYVNGSKVEKDAANTITVVVDGYMLIGALSMDVEVPDVDESVSFLDKIKNFFLDIINWFKNLFK